MVEPFLCEHDCFIILRQLMYLSVFSLMCGFYDGMGGEWTVVCLCFNTSLVSYGCRVSLGGVGLYRYVCHYNVCFLVGMFLGFSSMSNIWLFLPAGCFLVNYMHAM